MLNRHLLSDISIIIMIYHYYILIIIVISYTSLRQLQSCNIGTYEFSRTHTNLGDSSFTVAGTTYLSIYMILNL